MKNNYWSKKFIINVFKTTNPREILGFVFCTDRSEGVYILYDIYNNIYKKLNSI